MIVLRALYLNIAVAFFLFIVKLFKIFIQLNSFFMTFNFSDRSDINTILSANLIGSYIQACF